jgi:putative transposase
MQGVLSMSTYDAYPTNLSDAQWALIEPLLPKPKWQAGGPGRPPRDLRTVVNGMFYVNKTGCQWYMLPRDFGPNRTIYGYFRAWREQGVWTALSAYPKLILYLSPKPLITPSTY